jgi:2'-5' RNA ligase
MPPAFRYFLGFRPDPPLRALLAALQPIAGQREHHVAPPRLHLTLCAIAETATSDAAIVARTATALAGDLPEAPPIRLGRVHARATGAEVVTRGSRREICAFYDAVAARLRAHGIDPLHRKAGLRPHVTLGYDACEFAPFDIAAWWLPGELLLIESHIGRGAHAVLLRLPLAPPAQASFAFDEPPLRLAA